MPPAPPLLGVNIDHVATLRQARHTFYPSPLDAALLAEGAGADLITVHLREDRRHIQEEDVHRLAAALRVRLNLEMAMTEDMINFVMRLQPSDCCLVPERREELTTEGGLDVAGQTDRVRSACARITAAGVRLSLFIDPVQQQVDAASKSGAPVIEIHTGHYANAATPEAQERELNRIRSAAHRALALGLQVNAGHGLHYDNVLPIAALPEIRELNIGHSIICRAVLHGLPAAVREMKQCLQRARA
ncbi:MAG TPA: pyridoxine 5'-phosphate synthase [Gammaproteobacteria bacterium]|nr:pyridoxine 5'-phosphate synthase [Gammaproteobacteria bacterium]